MASSVSWMEFDAEQQRRTDLVMAALSEQGTIDELGLGIIRDLVSAAILPGIVNPMVRVKYLLLVPRDFTSLSGRTAEALLADARRHEGRRVGALKAAHESDVSGQGIIGARTGAQTQRLPSAIYWGLLQRLGILHLPGSVADYCRALAQTRASEQARSVLRSEDDTVEASPSLWAELPEDPGAEYGLDLDRDEAEWLRERFLAAEDRDPDHRSLMTWHLEAGRTWHPAAAPWDHPDLDDMPTGTRRALLLGRDLDAVVHGARILYNYLCALHRPDHGEQRDTQLAEYTDAMAQWREQSLPSGDRLDELDRWGREALAVRGAGGLTLVRWNRTLRFICDWHAAAASRSDLLDSSEAARIVADRERELKGPRARLTPSGDLRGWLGGVSYFRFIYNWGIARRFLDDIHRGLGTPTVEVG